jgi:TolB protein
MRFQTPIFEFSHTVGIVPSHLTRRTFTALTGLAGLTLSLPWQASRAELRVDVTGVGQVQIPLVIFGFQGEVPLAESLLEVVRGDLGRVGEFQLIAAQAVNPEHISPNWSQVRALGGDFALTGSVRRSSDGQDLEVRWYLWDAVRQQPVGQYGFAADMVDLRVLAHKTSDALYEALTGVKGIFSTRLTYIRKSGKQYQLCVCDSDGENTKTALVSSEPLMSPRWSPDGSQLAYVSFETRKPVVYVQDLASGDRKVAAGFRGSNSAPAWSPDGRYLVVTLTQDGNSQLYLMGAQGEGLTRLTQTLAIDTEATFSPDGQSLYFVSDRGGTPQIYRMPSRGGRAERVTFGVEYAISPALSPDGHYLAFVSRGASGQFRVKLMELSSGKYTDLADTVQDESPSFSPNGRLLVYATQIGLQKMLMVLSVNGKIGTKLAALGSGVMDPDWGGITQG